MELCDHSLSDKKASQFFAEGEVLKALHQVNILKPLSRLLFCDSQAPKRGFISALPLLI